MTSVEIFHTQKQTRMLIGINTKRQKTVTCSADRFSPRREMLSKCVDNFFCIILQTNKQTCKETET